MGRRLTHRRVAVIGLPQELGIGGGFRLCTQRDEGQTENRSQGGLAHW